MTILELAERDLKKAKHANMQAEKCINTPKAQLDQTRRLVELRTQIRDIVYNFTRAR